MDVTHVIVAVVVTIGIAGLFLQGVALRSVLGRGSVDQLDDRPGPR